jgi:DNA-binding PadR family transcriptional regulator
MTARTIDPAVFLPLRPLELLVLTVVADTPLHGYAIRQAIVQQTGDQIEVEVGNLYRHIRRLHADRLLEVVPGDDGGGERRRCFAATPLGRKVLSAELQRLATLVQFATERRIFRPANA